ncbi:MAG: ABC transporter permease [Chloroflexota bacterium]|nr:ABC transporter permease [Chloroflexota bacterium]
MSVEAEGATARALDRAAAGSPAAPSTSHRAERVATILSPVLLVVVWEAVAQVHLIDTRFFPPPSEIAAALGKLIASGELLGHLSASAGRVVIGFLIGGVPAVAIGLLMGISPLFRAFVRPLVSVTFPIPKIAILPLVILVFGLGEASKWAIVAIGVFFLVLINTLAGVLAIPRIYFDVARTVGASRWQQYLTVALPGALPSILTGVQLGFGIALVVLVAAEFVGAKTGVGYLIWSSWQSFLIERMWAGLVVIAATGYLVQLGLDWLEGRLVPWRGR